MPSAPPYDFLGQESCLTGHSLNGSGDIPVIAGVTHVVASAAVGHDMGGSFVLTSDATSASGTIATVTFGDPLPAAPVSVLVQVDNTTDGAHVATIFVASISATGFTIKDSTTLTASKAFLVSYQVIAS
jgi:hypothetical protein